jgi:hypothetical protein
MNKGEVFVLCIILAVLAVAAMAQWIADHEALGEHMFDWMESFPIYMYVKWRLFSLGKTC